jgi:hypothetical protein
MSPEVILQVHCSCVGNSVLHPLRIPTQMGNPCDRRTVARDIPSGDALERSRSRAFELMPRDESRVIFNLLQGIPDTA